MIADPTTLSQAGNRIVTLEVGRGVAALLVALFHCTGMYQKYFGTTVFDYAFHGGHSGVEYFFVLSGFIIYYMHANDIGQPERFGNFAVKRAIRILLLSRRIQQLAGPPGYRHHNAVTHT